MKRFGIPAAVLLLQSALLFSNLGLLPLWGDEIFTVNTVALPIAGILNAVARDIHPPLYFLLLHFWPAHSLAGLRAFSACWALAATILLDVFWTAKWRPRRRAVTLLLFACSPCLLLYGRMARSYSMQMALFLLAASLAWHWMRCRRGAVPAFAACLALLYTHYIPGLALMAAIAIAGLTRLGWRRLTLFGAALAAGYAPWMWTLGAALLHWGQASGLLHNYRLTDSLWTEQLLKLGFGAVSLAIGESFYAGVFLLLPCLAWLAWRGFKHSPRRFAAMIAIAALVGYLGVSRWVTYPFIPARMLWLLPFLTLAIGMGLGRRRWIGAVLILGSATSIFCYFREDNYLNKSYEAPLRELAQLLNAQAGASDLILADAYNTDASALAYYLGRRKSVEPITPANAPQLSSRVPLAPTVWIVSNPHDISPGEATTRMETLACAGRARQVTFYLPYNAWQRWVLARLLEHPPEYFYQLTRCQAR